MTARNWRYCGSGAVMMSELVAGSAWICPPVEGWLLLPLLDGPPESPVVVKPPVEAGGGAGICSVEPKGAAPPLPPVLAASEARKVTASLAASAFLR